MRSQAGPAMAAEEAASSASTPMQTYVSLLFELARLATPALSQLPNL